MWREKWKCDLNGGHRRDKGLERGWRVSDGRSGPPSSLPLVLIARCLTKISEKLQREYCVFSSYSPHYSSSYPTRSRSHF